MFHTFSHYYSILATMILYWGSQRDFTGAARLILLSFLSLHSAVVVQTLLVEIARVEYSMLSYFKMFTRLVKFLSSSPEIWLPRLV